MAGDGPLRQQLETQCTQLGVEARFIGTVPRQEIPQLLGAADALVSTSILYFLTSVFRAPECWWNVRVGENSPNLWPIMFSVTNTGMNFCPL